MHDGPWERLLTALENKLPPQVVDTWIRPGRLLACRDTHLDIGVPSPFIRSYVVKHYLPQLQMAAEECLGSGIQVTVSIDRASAAPSASPIPSPALASAPPVGDSRYTFNTFVVGSSNQFAQAACLAVAKQPSTAYNPLFLYGGVGLGKTHLLRAIGHEVSRTRPHLRADYLSTEKFTNELIGAIRSDKTREFRQRHRTIDLLLVDDVQFLSGKERTQEEFFHTFNDLYDHAAKSSSPAIAHPGRFLTSRSAFAPAFNGASSPTSIRPTSRPASPFSRRKPNSIASRCPRTSPPSSPAQ